MADDIEAKIALEAEALDKDKIISGLCTVSRQAAALCAVLESYIGEDKVVELLKDFRNEKLVTSLCKDGRTERIGDRFALYTPSGERVLVKEFIPLKGEMK